VLHAWRPLFHLSLRTDSRRYFNARYEAIAAQVPPRTRVTDVCAGDCWLYLKHLRQKHVVYLGLDIAPALVAWAAKHGANARVFNLWNEPVPPADIVVMQAGLYQFTPRAEEIVRKLLRAARQRLILAESIRNMTDMGIPFVSSLAGLVTRPVGAPPWYTGRRFNEKSLREFFGKFEELEEVFLIPGGQDMVGVFRGSGEE